MSWKVLILVIGWLLVGFQEEVQAICPKIHGGSLQSRPLLDSAGWTAINIGNPITCDGFITAWRFLPTQAAEFLALVWRPVDIDGRKYVVVGRTIIPAQQNLNQIQEHLLHESDWIPVLNGDYIGFKFDTSLLPYSNSSEDISMFLLASGIDRYQLLKGSHHIITTTSQQRTYSLQVILKDSKLPCHRISWPILKQTDLLTTLAKIWMDDWNKIRCPSTIVGWRFIGGGPGDIIMLVYRAVSEENNIYEIIGKIFIPSPTEPDVVKEHVLTYSEQIEVLPGDKVGITYTDVVVYRSAEVSNVATLYKYVDKPSSVEIGTQVTFSYHSIRVMMFSAILRVKEPINVFQSTDFSKDFKLQNHVIQSLMSRSASTCVLECVDNEECKSVNFNEHQMTCELNGALKNDDNGNYVSEVGETYFEVEPKFTNMIHGKCRLIDCGPGNECEELINDKRGYICMCSSTGYMTDHCPTEECTRPLGMESGAIFDDQISTSSVYDDNHKGYCGRLNVRGYATCNADSWSPMYGEPNCWLRIDLLVEHNITGIKTQGRADLGQWVWLYKISYQRIGAVGEMFMTDGYGKAKIFSGNWDSNTVRAHYFNPVIQAVAIKFTVKARQGRASMRVEVLGCKKTGTEWTRAFKGISLNGLSIYDAWISGNGSSSNHADKFLLTKSHYRNNAILNNWSALGITKVKLSLFSEFNVELRYIIFDGVDTNSTSWFSRDKIEESPWDDIKTAGNNYFSIDGSDGRRFFINHYYNGCPDDMGWFVIDEGNVCTEFDGVNTDPVILYSRSSSAQKWFTGDIGTARAMTIDVKM